LTDEEFLEAQVASFEHAEEKIKKKRNNLGI
jgi:hypothetical protein